MKKFLLVWMIVCVISCSDNKVDKTYPETVVGDFNGWKVTRVASDGVDTLYRYTIGSGGGQMCFYSTDNYIRFVK